MAQKRAKKGLPFSVFAQPAQPTWNVKGLSPKVHEPDLKLFGEFSLNVPSYFCTVRWIPSKRTDHLRQTMFAAITQLWQAEIHRGEQEREATVGQVHRSVTGRERVQLVSRSNGPFSLHGLGKNGMDDAIVGVECTMQRTDERVVRKFAVLPRCYPLKNTAFWTFPGLIERVGAVLFVGSHVSFVELKDLGAEALVAIDQALERGQA